MKLLSGSKRPQPTLPSDEDLAAFEHEMKETADEFLRVRDRFFAIRRAKAKYERAIEIDRSGLPQDELAQIDERIDSLKITLESQLLSWREAAEPFWQIVRYVGLGLVAGWFLQQWFGPKLFPAKKDPQAAIHTHSSFAQVPHDPFSHQTRS